MASFEKRGKTWQYTISRVINGKRDPIRKGGFKTQKEAKAAAIEIENKLNKGLSIDPVIPVPFDDYFENWVEVFKPHVGKNTKDRYKVTLKTIQEHFPSVSIQSITRSKYQMFLNTYAEGRTKETVKKLNSHIRACIQEAIAENIITHDFTKRAVLSGTKESKRPDEKHLDYVDSVNLLKDLVLLIKQANRPILGYYLLLLALTSGLRFGELVGLTREDFDFKRLEIKVTKTWGYTNKMPPGFGPTKNPQSVRIVSMDKATMDLFQDLFKRLPTNIHRLVFFSSQSKYKVISNTAVNKSLERLLNGLGIDSVNVHGLRHTHASILLYKGISIYYVSERLGHKDIQTTLDYYAHLLKEFRERDSNNTVKALEEMVAV